MGDNQIGTEAIMTARRDIEVKLNPGWLRRELRAASILMEEYREAEKRAEQRIAADKAEGGGTH